jgi:type I site-specific restriction-modification system R (restriction) subunit
LTSYLWEHVWQRDSWLEILGRYVVAERDSKKRIKSLIFPRYHQLDATRKLVAAILEAGPGRKYLIQHSAGSGKTNSIAWTAHFLADLHDANNDKLFASVIVVSDRNVIDAQLQAAIYDFEGTTGVVAVITNAQSSKSAALAQALAGGKKIVRLAHAIDKVLAAIPLPSCLVPRPTITKDRLTLGMVAGHLPLMKEPRPAGPPTSSPRPSSGPTHS